MPLSLCSNGKKNNLIQNRMCFCNKDASGMNEHSIKQVLFVWNTIPKCSASCKKNLATDIIGSVWINKSNLSVYLVYVLSSYRSSGNRNGNVCKFSCFYPQSHSQWESVLFDILNLVRYLYVFGWFLEHSASIQIRSLNLIPVQNKPKVVP